MVRVCHNLAIPDAAGLLVRKPVVWPAVRLQVQLQLPLLYWAERHRWMWHKKWTLPKLHMRVTCDGKPVGGVALPGGEIVTSVQRPPTASLPAPTHGPRG